MYSITQAMPKGRRIQALVIAVALIIAIIAFAAPARASSNDPATYRVTVENLTENQTITPAVVASHEPSFRIFKRNQPASYGLSQLAENGGVPVLAAELSAEAQVADVGVAGDAPIAPGQTATTLITTSAAADRISVTAMLICTNDGFAGASNIKTRSHDGEVTVYGRAFDAGSEINTQDYDDLVPPCSGIPDTGTGMSNPALAENGTVKHHKGIKNLGDLTPEANGWEEPVLKVTVERVSTYDVTITNLTTGQPITPGVLAAHLGDFSLFSSGTQATNGLQQLAENGGVPVLAAEVAGNNAVVASGVIGAAPIAPGGSASGSIEIVGNATTFSLAAMLVCTNDGFGGVDGVMLPRHIGDQSTVQAHAYDAGTEINTESFADLVPPCDGDLDTGTGTSNPALAENGSVQPHAGIAGIADLTDAHDWNGPVLSITIERTS
jgi:hypothetical protein